MNAKLVAIGIQLAMFSVCASAQWRENGKIVPDTSWRKGWGSFGAMLQLTNKPDELFANWGKEAVLTAPLMTTHVVRRGETLVGVVLFSGCSVDDKGVCNAHVVFQIFRPDGAPYSKAEHAELWIGKPSPRDGQLQLGVGAIGAIIEPQDPNGTYTIRALLNDRVSNTTAELITTFQVADTDPHTAGEA